MTCRQIEPYIVDFARMAIRPADGRLEEMRIAQHLLECPTCAGLLERERTMSAALRRLGSLAEAPVPNPQQERALLAMFDESCTTRAPSHMRAPLWASVAVAGLALGTFLTWHWPIGSSRFDGRAQAAATIASQNQLHAEDPDVPITVQKQPAGGGARTRTPAAPEHVVQSTGSATSTDFVVWPGAGAWPPFESGELIRINLPLDALAAIGFTQLESDATVVQADVLIGQDGFARAIRLVQ